MLQSHGLVEYAPSRTLKLLWHAACALQHGQRNRQRSCGHARRVRLRIRQTSMSVMSVVQNGAPSMDICWSLDIYSSSDSTAGECSCNVAQYHHLGHTQLADHVADDAHAALFCLAYKFGSCPGKLGVGGVWGQGAGGHQFIESRRAALGADHITQPQHSPSWATQGRVHWLEWIALPAPGEPGLAFVQAGHSCNNLFLTDPLHDSRSPSTCHI